MAAPTSVIEVEYTLTRREVRRASRHYHALTGYRHSRWMIVLVFLIIGVLFGTALAILADRTTLISYLIVGLLFGCLVAVSLLRQLWFRQDLEIRSRFCENEWEIQVQNLKGAQSWQAFAAWRDLPEFFALQGPHSWAFIPKRVFTPAQLRSVRAWCDQAGAGAVSSPATRLYQEVSRYEIVHEFEWSRQDRVRSEKQAYHDINQPDPPELSGWRRMANIFALVVLISMGAFVLFQGALHSTFQGILVGGAWIASLAYVPRWFVRWQNSEFPNPSLACEVRAFAEGLSIGSKHNVDVYGWDGVTQLLKSKDFIGFHAINGLQMVPRRSFVSKQAEDAFRDRILNDRDRHLELKMANPVSQPESGNPFQAIETVGMGTALANRRRNKLAGESLGLLTMWRKRSQ